MAFGIGNFGKIASDFSSSLGSIFGKTSKVDKGTTLNMFTAEYGGSLTLDATKWTGNTENPNAAKYGFVILPFSEVGGTNFSKSLGIFDPTAVSSLLPFTLPGATRNVAPYYLDIPPQNITQKEIFANNIQATRKGIIVETEGVVFKDIIIEGTTGVFPGQRGEYAGNRLNSSNLPSSLMDAPDSGGISKSGESFASGVKNYTGYEEFLRLRQYFLFYAKIKVKANGGYFLIFINEKDNQSLIVEPMEFTMIRSSKSPMSYNYRIVLKCIGTLQQMYSRGTETNYLDLFNKIGNIAANVSAGLQQTRAVINLSRGTLERFSQALTQTFLDPLRQVQFAMEDLAFGKSSILSLPDKLMTNVNNSLLDIRESNSILGGTSTGASSSKPGPKPAKGLEKMGTTSLTSYNDPSQPSYKKSIVDPNATTLQDFDSANRIPLPRSFVETLKAQTVELRDNLTDFLNVGDAYYNEIKKRFVTSPVNPLKIPTDSEWLLLDALNNTEVFLNSILSNNSAFMATPEILFSQEQKLYGDLTTFVVPSSVRQITILQGDTLEKIAAREYGDPFRWIDLVIINNLKPPFISNVAGEGVKIYGDTLLVGNL